MCGSRPVVWRKPLAVAARSQHSSKGLNTRKLISFPNLSATTGFSYITRFTSVQVLSGVSQVQLSGYPFVYNVIIIIISFPNQLIVFCSFFVHLLLNHLLFLSSFFGVKISRDAVQPEFIEQETNCFWRVLFTFFIFCIVSDTEVSLAGNKMNPRDNK